VADRSIRMRAVTPRRAGQDILKSSWIQRAVAVGTREAINIDGLPGSLFGEAPREAGDRQPEG
jgi:hypothetical protein